MGARTGHWCHRIVPLKSLSGEKTVDVEALVCLVRKLEEIQKLHDIAGPRI
jgi:hypothetical protein